MQCCTAARRAVLGLFYCAFIFNLSERARGEFAESRGGGLRFEIGPEGFRVSIDVLKFS